MMSHFPNWKEQICASKASGLKSVSDRLTVTGALPLKIVFPHPRGNTRIEAEFVILENGTTNGLLLGMDYHRMYGIDSYNSVGRYFTIGGDKSKKFKYESQEIRLITENKLESLKEEFKEAEINPALNEKQE